ncbi:hypothetical protein K474DRAFT_1671824 [Panus rudis PR-1116 ss-1]|nr:hypothetical protein K474DRAFT_1671824 [Panus rudis PR-1116 ss-1]
MTKDLLIALMGPTGTGKSTVVLVLINSKFQTSAGLKSCTAEVQISQPFGINETRVQLVDTPGFDDTHASDADILGRIAGYLASSFEQGLMLSGVIYMHRITDYKIGGVSRKNFNMFRQLCGAQAMCNVIIVTNMWNLVNRDVGEARERELMSDELLFKPVLDAGAKMIRHDGTAESARRIVSQFFRKEPTPLRIQQEIVTEGKDISHTAACQELDKALATVRRRQQVELADLEKQMEEAILEQDRQTYEELELCRAELQKDVMRVEAGRKRLSEAFLTERIQSERQLQELVHMIEEQARAVGARNSLYEQAEYRHRQRIAELQRQLQIVQNAASRTLSEVASETSSVGGTEVTYTLVADEATAPASAWTCGIH